MCVHVTAQNISSRGQIFQTSRADSPNFIILSVNLWPTGTQQAPSPSCIVVKQHMRARGERLDTQHGYESERLNREDT